MRWLNQLAAEYQMPRAVLVREAILYGIRPAPKPPINTVLRELAAQLKAYRERIPERLRARAIAVGRRRQARMNAAFVEEIDRRVVYDNSRGICGICKNPVSFDEFSIDHIIPIARGGLHAYSNVQAAHGSCNSRKSDRIL